ncbi:MAG: hypothetical protein IIB53_16675 [Planctomycetes bacterium]|nr:hypothetical protein [Planctomycetota bacterium]
MALVMPAAGLDTKLLLQGGRAKSNYEDHDIPFTDESHRSADAIRDDQHAHGIDDQCASTLRERLLASYCDNRRALLLYNMSDTHRLEQVH